VGKKQRYTEFIPLSDGQVKKVATDPRTPTELRQKAIAELKFRAIRNIQKRRR
jgi:hypothetical protein